MKIKNNNFKFNLKTKNKEKNYITKIKTCFYFRNLKYI